MSPEQKHLARHALGLDNARDHISYRNRYFTPQTSEEGGEWMQMVHAGDAAIVVTKKDWTFFELTLQGAMKALEPKEVLDPEDFPHAHAVDGPHELRQMVA